MILSAKNFEQIENPGIEISGKDYLSLSEKVLQFGTGGLLRGLPDYFIDQANKQGLFNGRIVVVKSTDTGSTDGFEDQDNLKSSFTYHQNFYPFEPGNANERHN
jgi:tagaturonate reductase